MTKWIVAALLTLTLQAKADQITLGFWDHNVGGGVTPFASSPGPEIHIANQMYGAFGGNVTALTFTSNNSTWREFAFDNFFQTKPDTIRLYADFQGVTTTPGQTLFPTIWQRNEALGNGIVVAEEIYGCADGVLFCDDYICLLLLYFFTPAITSLRALQQVSGWEKTRQKLGIRRTSLGSSCSRRA